MSFVILLLLVVLENILDKIENGLIFFCILKTVQMAFSSAICYFIVTVTIVQVSARYVHVQIDLDCGLSLIHHSNCESGSRLSKCRNRGFLVILCFL